jgi:hypothetical protein
MDESDIAARIDELSQAELRVLCKRISNISPKAAGEVKRLLASPNHLKWLIMRDAQEREAFETLELFEDDGEDESKPKQLRRAEELLFAESLDGAVAVYDGVFKALTERGTKVLKSPYEYAGSELVLGLRSCLRHGSAGELHPEIKSLLIYDVLHTWPFALDWMGRAADTFVELLALTLSDREFRDARRALESLSARFPGEVTSENGRESSTWSVLLKRASASRDSSRRSRY